MVADREGRRPRLPKKAESGFSVLFDCGASAGVSSQVDYGAPKLHAVSIAARSGGDFKHSLSPPLDLLLAGEGRTNRMLGFCAGECQIFVGQAQRTIASC